MNCLICNTTDADRHHVKTRGSGGTNEESNIVHLCRTHHIEIHQIGNGRFMKRYTRFKSWLVENGRHDIIERTKRLK